MGIQHDLTSGPKEEEKRLKEEAERKTNGLSNQESGEFKYGVQSPIWARQIKKISIKKTQ